MYFVWMWNWLQARGTHIQYRASLEQGANVDDEGLDPA